MLLFPVLHQVPHDDNNNNMNNNRPHKTKSERPALAAPILAPVGLGWADWLGAAAARFLFLQKVREEFMSNSFPSWAWSLMPRYEAQQMQAHV